VPLAPAPPVSPPTRTPASLEADPAYADFFGLADSSATDLLLAVGNCQVESVRQLLDGAPAGLRSVRVPPVFELAPQHVSRLHRLLARTAVLVAQPVRAGYRGLDLGTDALTSALPPGSSVVRVPPVRWSGMHPWHAVHHPEGTPDPPLVAYHDLRVLAGFLRGTGVAHVDERSLQTAVPVIARTSQQELARRRRAFGTVDVGDAFDRPGPDHVRTVNHPGNPVLALLASRVAEEVSAHGGRALGAVAPQRPLLDSVLAPVDPVVADHWDVPARRDWVVDGVVLAEEQVHETHLRWYAEHPEVAETLARREQDRMRLLGLVA